MPGGPIAPISAVPDTSGRLFPNVHIGSTNSKLDEGLGVEASLGADAIWHLRFKMPEVLPSGTAKLQLWALADATSGAAKVNPKWVSVNNAENPDTATRNAEGTSTLTWASGNDDDYHELLVTLDADTIVAGEMVVMDLTFETSSWTLAAVSTWIPFIIWE